MGTPTCNPSTWKVETEGILLEGHGPHVEYQASQSFTARSYLKEIETSGDGSGYEHWLT